MRWEACGLFSRSIAERLVVFLIDYCFMWNIHVLDTARLYSDACINRSQGQKNWENVCWEIVEDIK